MSPTTKKKTCSRCKKIKPVSEFCIRSNRKSGLDSWCKGCKKEYNQKELNKQTANKYNKSKKGKAARKKAGEKYRRTEKAKLIRYRRNLKDNYGITLKQYDEMFENQNGVCIICGGVNESGRRLYVDHNHKTKEVRGLLCHMCNIRLSVLENKEFVIKAKKYLKKYK